MLGERTAFQVATYNLNKGVVYASSEDHRDSVRGVK